MASTDTTTKCRRCHRTLRDAKSIATGLGPTCARKIAADTAEFTPEQTAKAARLAAAGTITRIPSKHFHGLYEVQGVHGTYQTTTTDCTCQGAVTHGGCYHQLAVRLTVHRPAVEVPTVEILAAPTPTPTTICRCGHTAAQHDEIGCTGTVSPLPGVLPAAPCDCRQHTAAVPARTYITAA